jgi:peptidoglycan/xylan/chitin deacetylase (PgdA/CDA1 family)
MDHALYPYSPLPQRPPLQWPSGSPVALAVVVLSEHVEFQPPEGSVQAPLNGGVVGSAFPPPNLTFFSQREYGHRAGIFRILNALRSAGVPATVAMDAMTAERYPYVVDTCLEHGAEIVAHGISASQVVSSAMSEADERAYLTESRDRIEAATGQKVKGWYGPEQSESERTPLLLDELGFDYVCDWPNDDQPYLMSTPNSLVSVPTNFMLDDGFSVWFRQFPPQNYTDLVGRALTTLARDGETSARQLVLVVRPWLTGQPYRIGAFEHTLANLTGSGKVWAATTGEIASTFRKVLPT